MSAPDDPLPQEEGTRSVRQVILHAALPVRILTAGVFLNRLGSFFSAFLILFLRQEHFSFHLLPVILLAVGAATPVGSLLGGWAADRFSRKASLVSTTLLAAVSLAAVGEATARPILLGGVFGAALFAQAYIPAASALLVDYSRPQDRVPTFALFRLALNLGAAVGPLLAVFVAPHGLHLLFLFDSATYLLFGAWLAYGLPSARRSAAETSTVSAAVSDPAQGRVRSVAWMLAIYASVLLITAVYYQYSSSVPLAVTAHHSTAAYAVLLTLNGVLVILFELPLTAITRRINWRIPMASGTALMAIGIAISGAFRAYPVIALGVVTWTAGEILFSPVVNAAIASFSPPDRIGQYQGYLSTIQSIAFAVGPAAGVFVYSRSPAALWGGCLVVGAIACAGILSTRSRLPAYLGKHAARDVGAVPAHSAAIQISEDYED